MPRPPIHNSPVRKQFDVVNQCYVRFAELEALVHCPRLRRHGENRRIELRIYNSATGTFGTETHTNMRESVQRPKKSKGSPHRFPNVSNLAVGSQPRITRSYILARLRVSPPYSITSSTTPYFSASSAVSTDRK